MKILLDARLYGLENAGIGRYLVNLVGELAKIDKKNKYSILLRKDYFHSLKLPENWKKILADFRHYSFIEQIKLPTIISSEKPNLSHFPHFNVPLFFTGKFVVTIHDLTMHRQGRNATTLVLPIYYAKRLPYKFLFRKAVNSSVAIISPTGAVKKDIIDYYKVDKDKISVVYEGISAFSLNSKNLSKFKLSRRYFIYVGNLYPHKNINRVIEAVMLLNRNSKIKTHLVIVSSRGVFTSRLKKTIKKMKAEKYVKFLGFVPDEELHVLLKKSVAFVYPSLSEGFGLQGLESLSAGTLVLASDISAFREIYKENAIYFNPFDFTSISEAMSDVVKIGGKKRSKMIEKGQKFVNRYSWSKMARQTLKIYESSARLRQGE
ncbi:MAG: glycosyltransferase family 4 protein [Patescibacteria group bacterium]